MSQQRRRRAEIRIRAAQRVEAVWGCVNTLRPDLPLNDREDLARHFLDLAREEYVAPKPIRITPAQVQNMFWRNMHCAKRHCPIVLFSRELADELNEFFWQEEK